MNKCPYCDCEGLLYKSNSSQLICEVCGINVFTEECQESEKLEYVLVTANVRSNLYKYIKELKKYGWKLYGQPIVDWGFAQAMIRNLKKG